MLGRVKTTDYMPSGLYAIVSPGDFWSVSGSGALASSANQCGQATEWLEGVLSEIRVSFARRCRNLDVRCRVSEVHTRCGELKSISQVVLELPEFHWYTLQDSVSVTV
jgi:hypothetical protein